MISRLTVAALCLICAPVVRAAYIPVAGSPIPPGRPAAFFSFQREGTGHSVNASGLAVGWVPKYVNGGNRGYRPYRWDAAGSVTELPILSTDPLGFSFGDASVINDAGQVGGQASMYVAGQFLGNRPVRWNPDGSVFEMGLLGTSSTGMSNGLVRALNDAGVAAGFAVRYLGGQDRGEHPVRWTAAGVAQELPVLGTDGSTSLHGDAVAINNSNVAIGYAFQFDNAVNKGARPMRWDPAGVAMQLPDLGTDAVGSTDARATDINDAGTVIGFATKFSAGQNLGQRAVRWSPDGSLTELPHLGTDPGGATRSTANAISQSGFIVGNADKYSESGAPLGTVAVRWSPAGEIMELPLGFIAFAVNDAGFAVGLRGGRAFIWDPGGNVTDLNDLIDPASGWRLSRAHGISDTGYITGTGTFNAGDGSASISRLYTIHVPWAAVPEPHTFFILLCATPFLIRRRR